jgi:YVTN family beta-propeller protein
MLYYKDRLYVANFGSNTVSVVDPNQRKVVNTIPVGGLPVGLSVNPLTGVIYVTNLGSKTVSEIRDVNLLAGVNINVSPTNSGHIECGKNKISDTRYTRYPVDEDIMCKAYAGTNSVFESWTSDLPFIESTGTDEVITFRPSKFANVTANFQVLQELQLPKEYTEQLYSVMSTMTIPIIVSVIGGWSIPAVARWINGKRQRGYLRRSMTAITSIHETQYQNKENYINRFEDVRRKADALLTDGKITEEHYGILNSKISEYEDDINRLFHD